MINKRYKTEGHVGICPLLLLASSPPQPKLGDILEPRQTRRVIVLTTWRSGSTFLGDLLNAWPGAYYHFEPLHFLARKIRVADFASDTLTLLSHSALLALSERETIPRQQEPLATGLLRTLLTCHFDQRITPYFYYITSPRYNFLQKKNVRLNPLCRGRGLCQDPSVMATACAFHPLNFAKTVRLRLAAVKPLLEADFASETLTLLSHSALLALSERETIPRQQEPLATGLLRTLLTCHFDQRITPYFYYITSPRYNFLQKKNVRLNPLCRGRGLCQDPSVMATACAFHPLNFAKTVRLRLAAVKQLLEDASLDLRVVHLVRDPRGVVNSRLKMPWCSGRTCRDMSNICRAANHDAQTSQEFRNRFPKQYLLQRYEDLVDDPYMQTRKIFEFLDLPLVEALAVYIEEHMNTVAKRNEQGDDYTYAAQFSTFRNSSTVSTRWRLALGTEKVHEIQSLCRPALRYYGYRIFSDRERLRNLTVSVIEDRPGRSLSG
ncbi:uncharacterized protein LOC122262748 [Penaeus japonicus]|uniref:uncharacterized protein LOC122262748 n=1 Tax=Penaeus japonicus TaxID=27405 RepID=UPI001C710975|nr:uncharacterized protein LOC122262748 [Penaeus japonicus]